MSCSGSTWCVLGSGFGLYGYIPALIRLNQQIILPVAKRSSLLNRAELLQYADSIDWQPDLSECMKRAKNAVVAVPPTAQPKLVRDLFENGCSGNIILEKPIAVSPSESESVIDFVEKNYVNFRVNYSFMYTKWYQKWLKIIGNDSARHIFITWDFMAHHYRNNISNWKQDHYSGGGILRFYGIHVLAILCEISGLKIKKVMPSYDEENRFYAVSIEGLHKNLNVHLRINSKSETNLFNIKVETKSNTETIVSEDSPFSETKFTCGDLRVPYLESLVLSFGSEEKLNYTNKIKKINRIWHECEGLLS